MRQWILILAGWWCGTALAAELHVMPRSGDRPEEGSVLEDGSVDRPWHDVQTAVDHARPGDIVVLHPGRYRSFVVTRAGRPGAPITIRSREPHAAVIRGTTPYQGRNAAIHVVADHVVIEGLRLEGEGRRGTRERGIRVSGFPGDIRRGVVIRGNRIEHFAAQGITTSLAEAVVIEHNRVCCTLESHGIYVANSADRPRIVRNVVHDCRKAAIHMNGDRHVRGGDGVITGALIEGNLLYRNVLDGSSSVINLDGVERSVIRNNLLVANRGQGISNFVYDGARPSAYNRIVNNTLIMADGSFHGLKFRDGSTHGLVRNNVLINTGRHDALSVDEESLTGFDSDYNLVTRVEDPRDRRLTLSRWQREYRQDRHSIDGLHYSLERLFVRPDLDDPERGDFTPRTDGPLVDRGVLLDETGELDQAGNPRVMGRSVDIGALESQERRP